MFLCAALPAAAADRDERYGYYRVVEGSATVVQQAESQPAQENQPLLSGDRLRTARGARAEVVLADGTLLRVAADTDVAFEELADSSDSDAQDNLLTLSRGEVQLVAAGAETRVDTDNASIYLRSSGNYRVESRDETTLLVVRQGSAEVRTRRGAIGVRADEEAWIEGDRAPEVEAAGTGDALERWASTLDDQYRRARWDDDYVDSSLGYSASRMAEHGSWVTLSNRRAWRPRVGADWSPYRNGRWSYTPSGLTWVSYESWGWVPYHYGTWDYTPGWGWAWYPGRTYAPAWVYWYWGPSYVGWVPLGYYSHYYGPRFYASFGGGFDFTWGFGRRVHGWAGGSPRHFDRWNFVDCHNLYDSRLAYHTRSAAQLGAQGRNLARGIISTETRGMKPGVATRPSEGMWALANDRSGWEKPVRELPDVSRFVARDPNLGADVGRSAMPVDRNGGVGGRGQDGGRGWTPGEKPAMAGDAERGRGAEARPGRGAVDAGAGGTGVGGARNGRPDSGAVEPDWRGGSSGRGSAGVGSKPQVETRPSGGKPAGAAPGDTRPGGWRQRPDGAGGGSGVTSKPVRPSNDGASSGGTKPGAPAGASGPRPRGGGDEGWRGNGSGDSPQERRTPRATTRSSGAEPRGETPRGRAVEPAPGSDDESWRGAGREGSAGGRSPVRRVVEGVRSNRQEPADVERRPETSKPAFGRETRRPEPSTTAPSAPRQRPQAAPPAPRPEPDRSRASRPPEPQRESVRDRGSDPGPSRGAADRGDRGDRGNRGNRDSGDRGSRGGSDSRPNRSSKDSGEPNR